MAIREGLGTCQHPNADRLPAVRTTEQGAAQRAEHTPGPWEFHKQPHSLRIGDGLDFSIMRTEPLECLLLLAPAGEVTPTFHANARLIAAAPDMYATLVGAEIALARDENIQAAIDIIRAAIRKATQA